MFSELHKDTKIVAKVLKNLASCETHQALQNALFFCAQRYERIEKELCLLAPLEELTSSFLMDSKRLIVSPYRVCNFGIYFEQLSLFVKEVLNDAAKSSSSGKATTGGISVNAGGGPDLGRCEQLQREHRQQVLPLHTKLFEEHRQQCILSLVSRMLTSDIRYHCRAVEELSTALAALEEITCAQPASIDRRMDDAEDVQQFGHSVT